MPQKRLAAALVVLFAFASVARATITANLVLSADQPSAGAITDAQSADSVNLANYKTYDLNITLSGSGVSSGNTVGDDWQSAQIYFKLGTGSFYRAQNSSTPHGPQSPSFWTFNGLRHLRYDTFLAAPPDFNSNPLILDHKFYPPEQQTDPAVWAAQEMNVIWGDDNNTTRRNAVGSSITFTIGRFTIANGSTGFLYGQVFSEFSGGPVQIGTAGTGFTPEPASLSLIGIAAGFMLRRPKRSVTRA